MKLVILSSSPGGSVFLKENLSGSETRQAAGLEIHFGKLGGHLVALLETTGAEVSSEPGEGWPAGSDPEYLISLGEAYSCKKNLDPGDMVISSGALFPRPGKGHRLEEAWADQKLIDWGLKAAERFNHEERLCKVVVGAVLLQAGTAGARRKPAAPALNDVYCIDRTGYPYTTRLVTWKIPFVLVRTVVPGPEISGRLPGERFKWEMARRNFWLVKGILDELKKIQIQETVGKVDLV